MRTNHIHRKKNKSITHNKTKKSHQPGPSVWVCITVSNTNVWYTRLYRVNSVTLDLSTADLYYEGSTQCVISGTTGLPGGILSGDGALHDFIPYRAEATIIPLISAYQTSEGSCVLRYKNTTLELRTLLSNVTAFQGLPVYLYQHWGVNPTSQGYFFLTEYLMNTSPGPYWTFKIPIKLDGPSVLANATNDAYINVKPAGSTGACRLTDPNKFIVDVPGGYLWAKNVVTQYGDVIASWDLRNLPGLGGVFASRIGMQYSTTTLTQLNELHTSPYFKSEGFRYGNSTEDGGAGYCQVTIRADYSFIA